MERKIIYYPTIIVPSEWAKWAVLYFDKVSSIIPKGVDYREIVNPWNEKDFKIMKILMKEGEFEPPILNIYYPREKNGQIERCS